MHAQPVPLAREIKLLRRIMLRVYREIDAGTIDIITGANTLVKLASVLVRIHLARRKLSLDNPCPSCDQQSL